MLLRRKHDRYWPRASPCPLLAQSRRELVHRTCLLSGVKRTLLFATGLGALGLLGWRRKRKTQAAAA